MSAFSSKESCSLERTVDISTESIVTDTISLSSVYELDRCLLWIQNMGAKKVCLQFPDALLCDAMNVALHLEMRFDGRVSILGDTSYGSCCVDEVAAQHFAADAIIHFGNACLSPTNRLPILYIFEKRNIDVSNFVPCFHKSFATDCDILILYEVSYLHAIDQIFQDLTLKYTNLVVSELATNTDAGEGCTRKLGRDFTVPEGKDLSEYKVIFIGEDGRTLSNFLLDMNAEFYLYNTVSDKPTINLYAHQRSKFLMRRMYLVERVKDAKTLGIVIGTLGVSNYLSAVDRIKQLARKSGKKCYIIAVGKPNVPKLANFPEVDVFVLVACPENSLLDSKEFYRPIVTPYDVELAINPELEMGQTYVTDFREMLPGGCHYTDVSAMSDRAADMSLISGRLRCQVSDQPSEVALGSDSVAVRSDGTVAVSGSTGGQFLGARTWRGLEQSLGETEVTLAQQGRSGIAQNYQEMDS